MSIISNSLVGGPLGIVGFGAFGQLVAKHMRAYFPVLAFDPAFDAEKASEIGVEMVTIAEIARCPWVVIAVPVGQMRQVIEMLAPVLRPGTTVFDVGSVKIEPAAIMLELLPPHVDIVATHPLFGPQSAGDAIAGHRIAVCPLRGKRLLAAAFFRKIGLDVIMTNPEEHDREVAQVQGLTHAVARLLAEMKPVPTRMTTRSYELLMSAFEMVRHDSAAVSDAIFARNPYANDVLSRFSSAAAALNARRRN